MIQIVDTLAVFLVIGSVDMDDGMDALSAAVHEAGHRQFQLPDNFVLFLRLHIVRFDKGIFVIRHVFVPDTFAVEGIEANPRADPRVIVPQYSADVAVADRQFFDEFTGRAFEVAFAWQKLPVFFP